MVSARDHELVQQAIDGDLSPEDRVRFQELLDRDPEVQKLHDELRAAFAALAAVRPLEPPATLRPAVMRAIATAPAHVRANPLRWLRETVQTIFESIITPFTKEAGMSSVKGSSKYGWMIAGSVVAIVAVVYFSFYYPPAPADDAQGTIGAAQKYRSEQITDKDVVIGSASTSPFAEQIMADANTMQELGRTVSALGKTSADFGAKAGLDRTIAADLGRASVALERAVTLGKTAGLQKTIAADLLERTKSLDKNAAAAMDAKAGLDKNAAADLQRAAGAMELNAAAVSLDMTARSLDQKAALERTSIADLQRTALSLDRAAGLYRTGKLERSAVEEVLGMSAKFEKSAAPAFGKTATLDAKVAQELNRNAVELGKSANLLGQKFPAEMRSTLDSKSGLEGKQSLEGKQGLEMKKGDLINKNAPSQD
jgi:hypothetical protein